MTVAKGTTEVIFDDEIVGLQEYADCMQIQFRGAGERRFDVVIGADGLHSNVRRLVFG
jgi:2-polyprenyl-6-methoxyphenol hydroxylase-like FAD-dependent oxidoreductase